MIGLLAFALIACGVVAVTAIANEETDAVDGKVEYSKVFKSNSAETVDISTNESAFIIDAGIGSYEVKWTYQDGVAWQDLALGTDFTLGDWTYKLENKGDGLYTLTMNTAKTSATTEIHMKYMLVLKPADGGETTTGTIEIVVKISKNGSVLPDHVTSTIYGFKVDSTIDRTKGKITAYATTDESQPLDSSHYRWFAYTLPAGVSLSADGHLSGIPKTASGDGDITYKIYLEDAFGNIKEYTIGIFIGPRTENILPYYVHKGTTASFDPKSSHLKPKVSAVQKDDETYVVLKADMAETQHAKVTVVGGDEGSGYKQDPTFTLAGEYRFYKLPTGLTGAYAIIITTDLNIIDTTLYVLPQLDVVVAGIGVSSSSNANNGGGS